MNSLNSHLVQIAFYSLSQSGLAILMLFNAKTSFVSKFSTNFADACKLGAKTTQTVFANKWCCQWLQFNLSEFSSLSLSLFTFRHRDDSIFILRVFVLVVGSSRGDTTLLIA